MTDWIAFFIMISAMCFLACIALLLYSIERIGRTVADLNRMSREVRRTANSFHPHVLANVENDGSKVEILDPLIWDEAKEKTD